MRRWTICWPMSRTTLCTPRPPFFTRPWAVPLQAPPGRQHLGLPWATECPLPADCPRLTKQPRFTSVLSPRLVSCTLFRTGARFSPCDGAHFGLVPRTLLFCLGTALLYAYAAFLVLDWMERYCIYYNFFPQQKKVRVLFVM